MRKRTPRTCPARDTRFSPSCTCSTRCAWPSDGSRVVSGYDRRAVRLAAQVVDAVDAAVGHARQLRGDLVEPARVAEPPPGARQQVHLVVSDAGLGAAGAAAERALEPLREAAPDRVAVGAGHRSTTRRPRPRRLPRQRTRGWTARRPRRPGHRRDRRRTRAGRPRPPRAASGPASRRPGRSPGSVSAHRPSASPRSGSARSPPLASSSARLRQSCARWPCGRTAPTPRQTAAAGSAAARRLRPRAYPANG